jgi:hypothetical protein
MLPLDRRRRARRRTSGPRILALVAIALLLFLVIGGIFAIGHGSGPYHQSVNRSFVEQASVLVDQSNASARSLRATMAQMPNLNRTQLQFQLDALASATQRQAVAMHALAPPSPETNANEALARVFDQRAKAVAQIRSAVFGYLGITSAAVVGNDLNADTTTVGTTPVLLDQTQVAQGVTTAGATLQQSDHDYATARRSLRAATGHAQLPVSVWISNPSSWSLGAVQTQVDLVGGSVTLGQLHCLQLTSVRINPSALPALTPSSTSTTTSSTTTSTISTTTTTPATTTVAGASATSSSTTTTTKPKAKKAKAPTAPSCNVGASLAPTSTSTATLPPSNSLAVTAVVTNAGNVIEPNVEVQFSLQAQTTGIMHTVVRRVALVPNQSVTLAPVVLGVKPNQVYVLTVAVTPPPAQTVQSGLSRAYALQVAPATPPTTLAPTTTTSRSSS